MKKSNDRLMKRKDIFTPEVCLKIVRVFCFFGGLNFLLSSFYIQFIYDRKEFLPGFLLVSFSMFARTFLRMSDSQKENLGIHTIKVVVMFHTLFTVMSMIVIQFWWLLVAYVMELLLIIVLIKWEYQHSEQ